MIVPVDFSSYSAPALTMASRMAPNARIAILHAFRVPFEGDCVLSVRQRTTSTDTAKRNNKPQRK